MADLRQSSRWAKYMEALGWKVERINNCQIYIKKFPLGFGSLIKILRPNPPIPFEKIDQVAKKHKAWFVKLEPNQPFNHLTMKQLNNRGFFPTSWPLSPSKTIQINLKKSVKSLWADLKKETRNIIRKSIKNGVVVNQSLEIEQFRDLWVKSMRKKGNIFASGAEIKKTWTAFEENSHLLVAHRSTNKDQLLTGALIITFNQAAHYIFATSTGQGNKLGAPSLIVWEAILLAKKIGCRIFDFEGIYDPRFHQATKSWQGFTKFKKGFGGEEVIYVGTFIKPYNRLFRQLKPLTSNF